MENIKWEDEGIDAKNDEDCTFWCDDMFCVTHSPNERAFWFRNLVEAIAVYEVDTDTITFSPDFFEGDYHKAERQIIIETVDFIKDVLKLR